MLVAAMPALFVAARRYAPPEPNVLFVLIDTLRFDRVGPRGRERSLTPFLDRWSKDALVFDRAYAPSSWTIPSVASLFTGERPFEHGTLDLGDRLPAGAVTLAEALRAHGLETAAFLATGIFAGGDFERGFDTFRVVGTPGIQDNPDATLVNAAALDWLDRRDGARPFFLYLHYLDPHSPYRPHPGITRPPSPEVTTADEVLSWRASAGAGLADEAQRGDVWGFTPVERERLTDLYDGEVAYLDRRLETLFTALETRGALAHTIVVITADHGEEFGEHALFGHGVSLYETVIHVPLVVRVPGATGGARVARPVETTGLAAALLHAVGSALPSTVRIAALPLSGDEAGPAAPVVSQLGPLAHFALWRHRGALVEGDRKLLVATTGAVTVDDLRADPDEQRPGAPGPDDVARAAAPELTPPREVTGHRAEIPAAVVERLRALGYLQGPPPTETR